MEIIRFWELFVMAKKSERTPKSRIRSAMRMLSLKSRERSAALKRDGYKCVRCGSKEKIQVHHKDGIKIWDKLYKVIYATILCHPSKLETLCKECHDAETNRAKKR